VANLVKVVAVDQNHIADVPWPNYERFVATILHEVGLETLPPLGRVGG
jgi:hypothetical protein